MNDALRHSDWLSLVDISGPFLAEPVLREAFPQGMAGLDAERRRVLRSAYEEWREAVDLRDDDLKALHHAWIELVLSRVLEWDANVLRTGDDIPSAWSSTRPELGVTLRPAYAAVGPDSPEKPLCLVAYYPPDQRLDAPIKGGGWAASPAERMVELCRGVGVRLGLVTNGEAWMLVDAPIGGVTSFATWYGRIWLHEPITLQAFVDLLGVRRFFTDASAQLPALLDRSLEHQEEVTEALGEQVRRAIEILIQSLDRADLDRKRELLQGLAPREVYEAALTVLMRIVFLLSAEERGLLLMGDARYEAGYAVSTLRGQLRAETDEILERRFDAWARLLAIFRVVYAGVDHDDMRLPALGGSLFDPDRYPFLEGRAAATSWESTPALPLPIDNRTVLLILDAVQLFQGRTLSYRALDVEQIGHVYEGLLERTVMRAPAVTLDLAATKNAKNPWVTLAELETANASGRTAVAALLKERTGSSAGRVKNDLDRAINADALEKLLTACQGDIALRDRLLAYHHFLRVDRWGYPLVYPEGAYMVASGSDRRETGAHYTPKSLTEVTVKETLEPLVYGGPAEAAAKEQWRLKSPGELLDLKICDPAMGSGAFLVQVCRYMAERLVEAWSQAEAVGKGITATGAVVESLDDAEPLRNDLDERLVVASRMVAERCLYGVDMNPLAVELAKLSIWLVTLAKGRPFGFLDHNLRCGDSLLGITSIDQLRYLEVRPTEKSTTKLFASDIDKAVAEALRLRIQMRSEPVLDIRDIQAMARLDVEARGALALVQLSADALMGEVIVSAGGKVDVASLSIDVGEALAGDAERIQALRGVADKGLNTDLPAEKPKRQPLHWPLAFPEVFEAKRGGFDAFVGNPPFVGGQKLSGGMGAAYHRYLCDRLTYAEPASVDLVVYFFLRVFKLLREPGYMGMLARRSFAEGKNRDVGLVSLKEEGATIYFANTNIVWPGAASVIVHQVHLLRGVSALAPVLNGHLVSAISSHLDGLELQAVEKLRSNRKRMFQGTILNGDGFKVPPAIASAWIAADARYASIVFPFVGGNDVNSSPSAVAENWVINFWDWSEEEAEKYPSAYAWVVEKVKPERRRTNENGELKVRSSRSTRWWHHGEKCPGLYHAIGRGRFFRSHPKGWTDSSSSSSRVLVISRGVSKYPVFSFLENRFIFSEKLYLIADARAAMFAVLSSDIHALWAWQQKTSLGGDLYSLSYTQGEIFETFPFPDRVLDAGDANLEKLGEAFFKTRQSWMETSGSGLTAFYNSFHEKSVADAAIENLRAQQREINDTALKLYGWSDVELDMGFHDVGYLPPGNNTRFTISEKARLELLSRLATLNARRKAAEVAVDLDARKKDERQAAADDLLATLPHAAQGRGSR